MVQVWKIAPGVGAEDWELFRDNGCIGLGWAELPNYREYRTVDEVSAALKAARSKGLKSRGKPSAKMIWHFAHELKLQDVVVANEGYNRVVGIGVVASDYLQPKSAKNPMRKDKTTDRHHVRRMRWLITEPVDLPGNRFFARSTLYPLTNEKLNKIRQAYAAKYPRLKAILA